MINLRLVVDLQDPPQGGNSPRALAFRDVIEEQFAERITELPDDRILTSIRVDIPVMYSMCEAIEGEDWSLTLLRNFAAAVRRAFSPYPPESPPSTSRERVVEL